MITLLEAMGTLLSILALLLGYAGIRAYFHTGSGFYVLMSVAFLLTAIGEVIAGVAVYYIRQGDYQFRAYHEMVAATQTNFLGMVPMGLILLGLFLHLFQERSRSSKSIGARQVKDSI